MLQENLHTDRRKSNRAGTIELILDNAQAIARERGAAGLSMHELARRMSMRPPSLYNYFDGLIDVYDGLFQRGFRLFSHHLNQFTRTALSWQLLISQAMEAYLSFAIKNPELYQICFERPVPAFVPSQISMQLSTKILHQWYAKMSEISPFLANDLPPEKATDLLIAMMHGITALHIANEPELPAGQGRFGALIPVVVDLLEKAWKN